MKSSDQIIVSSLELLSHVGITSEERARAQRLTVSLIVVPERDFSSLQDDIRNALDYAVLCEKVRALAASGDRNLIETLVEEIAALVLSEFKARSVEIELRKYILPETEYVAVKICREAER